MNEFGYIKIHRQMTEWEWYTDPYVKGMFIHLLIKANYKDLRFKGKVIKRGQLVTSTRHLAEQLDYSRNTVKRCLKVLRQTHEIKYTSTREYTIITIVNFDKYQSTDQQGGSCGGSFVDPQGDPKLRNNRNAYFGVVKTPPNKQEVSAVADEEKPKGRPMMRRDENGKLVIVEEKGEQDDE